MTRADGVLHLSGAALSAPGQSGQDDLALAEQIINIMEQGILVWSAEGVCELHNTRVFDVLDLGADDLFVGMTRAAFRDRAEARGEMRAEDRAASEDAIRIHKPYSFDRYLPSGRVVLTNARPARGGSYVVTFTDVTEARRAAAELDRAKQIAEEAGRRAQEVLAQERARQDRARQLARLDEWLQSCQSLDELYQVVSTFMQNLLPGSKGELYLYSNSRDALVGSCNWKTTDLHRSIDADSCWALRRGRSYEYQADGLCLVCGHVSDHHHGVALTEYLCVPIIAHGDTVGLLHIRFDPAAEGAASLQEAGEFALRCAEHISMAIANVKLRDELHDRSIRDPLTGLFNRRYLMDALRRAEAEAERSGEGCGLIALDADNFKMFNDNHGHDAGDMVLRALAERVQGMAAPRWITCRMGGEEFAVLVPGADLSHAIEAAERIRAEIATLDIRTSQGVLPRVTVSAGVTVLRGQGESPAVLLKRADEALYRAKAEGRNRVMAAELPGAVEAPPGPADRA